MIRDRVVGQLVRVSSHQPLFFFFPFYFLIFAFLVIFGADRHKPRSRERQLDSSLNHDQVPISKLDLALRTGSASFLYIVPAAVLAL
jgi:hypothetical protein